MVRTWNARCIKEGAGGGRPVGAQTGEAAKNTAPQRNRAVKTLFGESQNLIGRVMDLQVQRQNVVMSNLANIKTPNYKAKRLDFEDDLQAALGLDAKGKMAITSASHMPSAFDPEKAGATLVTSFKPQVVHGEDAVNLDKEMAEMAKNSLRYNAMNTVLKRSYESMRNLITDAKGQ